jgi:hypothetical protein
LLQISVSSLVSLVGKRGYQVEMMGVRLVSNSIGVNKGVFVGVLVALFILLVGLLVVGFGTGSCVRVGSGVFSWFNTSVALSGDNNP